MKKFNMVMWVLFLIVFTVLVIFSIWISNIKIILVEDGFGGGEVIYRVNKITGKVHYCMPYGTSKWKETTKGWEKLSDYYEEEEKK